MVGSHSSTRRHGFLNTIGGNLVEIVVVVVTVVVCVVGRRENSAVWSEDRPLCSDGGFDISAGNARTRFLSRNENECYTDRQQVHIAATDVLVFLPTGVRKLESKH